MRAIIKSALAIDELKNDMENIATDDKKEIDQYTDAEILVEAKYVLEMFLDGTNPQESALGLAGWLSLLPPVLAPWRTTPLTIWSRQLWVSAWFLVAQTPPQVLHR